MFRNWQQALWLAIGIVAAGGEPGWSEERVDRYGDPLPPGATARFGTVRFRHDLTSVAGCFSADDKFVLIAGYSSDPRVLICDAESGTRVDEFADAVAPVCCSPDGRFVATGGDPRGVRLWDGKERRLVASLDAETSLRSLEFSADSQRLVAADGKTIQLWDVSGPAPRRSWQHVGDAAGATFVGTDVAGWNGTFLQLLDGKTG